MQATECCSRFTHPSLCQQTPAAVKPRTPHLAPKGIVRAEQHAQHGNEGLPISTQACRTRSKLNSICTAAACSQTQSPHSSNCRQRRICAYCNNSNSTVCSRPCWPTTTSSATSNRTAHYSCRSCNEWCNGNSRSYTSSIKSYSSCPWVAHVRLSRQRVKRPFACVPVWHPQHMKAATI